MNEIAAAQPTLRVRFVDQYTPFLENRPTTAFPSEVWSTNGMPDYDKIVRADDLYHPRRLSSIYAGELAADGLDLAEMRALVGSSPTVTNTWLLPSSARVQGAGAFWTTDLSLRNAGTAAATATVKFLGHSGDGRDGPERPVTLAAGETRTWSDVLSTLFGLSADWGPILVRSESSGLVVLGQTSTPGGGGTFGQSVPAFVPGDLVGATPRSIVGVRQDASFRTNLMLANAGDAPIEVHVDLMTPGGPARTTRQVPLGPLAFAQLNVAQRPRRRGRLRRRHRGLDADARRALRRLRLGHRPGHGRPADPPARRGRGRRVAPPLERAGAGGSAPSGRPTSSCATRAGPP